jgi:hypothetical protein
VGASKPEFEQLRQFAAIQESGGHCSLPEIGGPRRELRVGASPSFELTAQLKGELIELKPATAQNRTMNTSGILPSAFTLSILTIALCATGAERFVSPAGAHIAPFTDWPGAATNIQDAIDVSADGDTIWVTNGVYATGGKVMSGDLTNRVALDRALTLRSVNGPLVTKILGNGAVNGFNAVRCAWLTNGAVLAGFTLEAGATRPSGGAIASGGGAWCASSNAILERCIIRSNNASMSGGGVFQGTIRSSLLVGNAGNSGSAAYLANLSSCTVVSNTGPAVAQANLTNSIIYYNGNGGSQNYSSSRLLYCCATPQASGLGNITSPPQLLADGIHIPASSPCHGAGTNLVTGTDIDGRLWADPPSIGCAEWTPAPIITVAPRLTLATAPVGFKLSFSVEGQEPYTIWWFKNDALLSGNRYSILSVTNLVASTLAVEDAGTYQVIVSNTFGAATSSVTPVVIHCVDASSTSGIAPYATWDTAANSIQDAIDAAASGDIVLVTNGTYATGGKVMAGDLTNRVALDKALFVQSVNGPQTTIIQGAWHPGTTNGLTAVRCAWLTNGAFLRGFTLERGATRTTGDFITLQYGGGAWCASSNALLSHCIIRSNAAYQFGGGAYRATLNACAVIGNRAGEGGGAYFSYLNNCTVLSNSGLAISGPSRVTNSIVYYNASPNYDNFSTKLAFSCTTPLPTSGGYQNTNAEPQVLPDGFHLATTSPVRAAGTTPVTETDIDGEPWASPPSMGCDEWNGAPVILQQPVLKLQSDPVGFNIAFAVSGKEPFTCQWSKGGTDLENSAHLQGANTTNLVANGVSLSDAGEYTVVVSNELGIARSAPVRFVVHCVDALSRAPMPPYLDWATAAAVIQDAVDVAEAGEVVLVTNGVYTSGGKAMAGELTNRVAVTKPILVVSVNGYADTTIQGAWDPTTTNGPAAIRCAWVTNGVILSGFTLERGATATAGDVNTLQSGGGAYVSGVDAVFANCLIRSNSAAQLGGGCFGGQFKNCIITTNVSFKNGGGSGGATLVRCAVWGNRSASYGGGVYGGNLLQCTVTYNSSFLGGGGIDSASFTNCIVHYNSSGSTIHQNWFAPFSLFQAAFSSTTPLPPGPGNISAAPDMVDFFHVAVTSPCRGAGQRSAASGTDIDGELWASPPSIGCDEVWEGALTGPLTVSAQTRFSPVTQRQVVGLTGTITGRASRLAWDYDDGSVETNHSYLAVNHTWTNPGNYTVTFTAYNSDHPEGVSMSLPLQVLALEPPLLLPGAVSPEVFNLSFQGQPGVQYFFDQATSLAEPVFWQQLGVRYSTGEVMQVPLPKSTNDNRFYRVRIP